MKYFITSDMHRKTTVYKKTFATVPPAFFRKKIIRSAMILIIAVSMLADVLAHGTTDSNSSASVSQKNKSAARAAQQKIPVVLASTSWTAAFADIAGADNVETIAPASLRHPPEYEVTVSDIQKIGNSDFFVYAGFERMMQTLGTAVGNTHMVQIANDNSIATVARETAKIAQLLGTEQENEKRLASYVNAIEHARLEIETRGLTNAKVLCNRNQRYLALDLGFTDVTLFGPGEVTADQIADAKNGGYDILIDNVHNPVGSPLAEVAPNARYVIWRNFPEKVEKDALLHVVQENIATLLKVL
ncbi:MAG: ABC transporter substrate-binding protein [Treponema sp.]|nr:ABC transporter substrate-binding protein [Treponema sp.]